MSRVAVLNVVFGLALVCGGIAPLWVQSEPVTRQAQTAALASLKQYYKIPNFRIGGLPPYGKV